MRLDRNRRLQRILDCGNVLRAYPAGHGPAVRLDETPQGVADLPTSLVAGQDKFGYPGATRAVGIHTNERLGFLV
jgi:hypothetical protein